MSPEGQTGARTDKVMFVLWDVDAQVLLDPSLRERLAEVGVRRLQVNVDDDEVAPAMRISTERPIGAVVSVWTTGDPRDAAKVLTGVDGAGRVAGWRVEEHRRIEPPAADDGARMDALANVAVLRRPDDLSPEEWRHRWLVDHTPVAIRTQATFGYVQNVVLEAVTDDAPRVDALVEELFASAGMIDIHAFYGSDGDDAELGRRITDLMTSVGRFGADHDIDLVPTSRYLYELSSTDTRSG